jgi:hypothetical protein
VGRAESAAATDLAAVLADYAWIWADEGLELPIKPEDFYVVAVEANGNLTIANRSTGALLRFAPAHSFDAVTPLPGCPPYSLLQIDEPPDLAAWSDVRYRLGAVPESQVPGTAADRAMRSERISERAALSIRLQAPTLRRSPTPGRPPSATRLHPRRRVVRPCPRLSAPLGEHDGVPQHDRILPRPTGGWQRIPPIAGASAASTASAPADAGAAA